MKKILLLLSIVIYFGACKEPVEDKIHKGLKVYMEKNLNDEKSYEPISSYNHGLYMFEGLSKYYGITHNYRANNGFGATVLQANFFLIDTSTFEVVASYNSSLDYDEDINKLTSMQQDSVFSAQADSIAQEAEKAAQSLKND